MTRPPPSAILIAGKPAIRESQHPSLRPSDSSRFRSSSGRTFPAQDSRTNREFPLRPVVYIGEIDRSAPVVYVNDEPHRFRRRSVGRSVWTVWHDESDRSRRRHATGGISSRIEFRSDPRSGTRAVFGVSPPQGDRSFSPVTGLAATVRDRRKRVPTRRPDRTFPSTCTARRCPRRRSRPADSRRSRHRDLAPDDRPQ